MKKRNLILLSLVSLAMVGCKTNNDASSTGQTSATDKTSDVASTTTSNTSASSSAKDSSSLVSSSSSTDADSSSSSAIHLTDWTEAMKNEMKAHFDNQVVPFVDLGSDVKASYKSDKYFYRISATGTLDATLIASFKTTLTASGYTTKSETSASLRMDHASGFSIRFTQGTNTLIYMDIMYFEPYDKTSVTTYSDQTNYTDLLTKAQCENIPFIYLGSKKVTTSSDSTGNYITGGRASDTFLDDVKAAFENANKSLTAPDTWDFVKESKNGFYYYKATRTDYLNNVTTLRVSTTSIGVDLDGNDLSLCTMQLNYDPAIIPTDWTDAVKDEMKDELDDQTLPFLNIGTLQDDGYGSKFCYKKDSASGMNFYRLTGKGYTLDQTLVDSYETALNGKGYTTTSKTSNSLISENTSTGLSIRITSDAALAKTIYLDVQYYEPYNKAGVTSYGDDVDDMMEYIFEGVTDVPFIYLGTKKASFSSDYSYIKGGKAASTFFADAKASLADVNATKTEESQKWTVTDETDATLGAYVKAVRTNSDSSTDTMKIYTVTGEGKDFSGNDIKICALGLEHKEATVPAPTGSWSSSIKKIFSEKLGGHAIPYLDLKSAYNKPTFSNDTLTIEAQSPNTNTWEDSILDTSEAAFNCDTNRSDVVAGTKWAVTKDKANHKLTASISLDDGHSFNVEVTRAQDEDEFMDPIDDSYHAIVTIVLAQTPAATDWSDSMKTFFNTNLDGHVLPYFDIKDSTPATMYDYGDASITAADGTWNDSILTDAQAAFNNDTNRSDVAEGTTWAVTYDEDDKFVKATITFSDGCKMTVKVSQEEEYDENYDPLDTYHANIYIQFTQHN